MLMPAPASRLNSVLVVFTSLTQRMGPWQRHNIKTMAEAVCVCFSLLELYLSATRGAIHDHESCAGFNEQNDHGCHDPKQPESRMHSDGQLYPWLPRTVGSAFIHLGSPICMRIVSNFAITHRMVPSAWEQRWVWHIDIVSVKRCEMLVRTLALTIPSRRSTNWTRQRLPPTNLQRTF